MKFDVINLTDTELSELSVVQMKLLRTAQQKKDELYAKADKELENFNLMLNSARMYVSSLQEDMAAHVDADLVYQKNIIADNLIYNMSLNEPTTDSDLGNEGGDEGAGYIVDYSLSYNQRYVIVRDYYMSIPDPAERLALYQADEVAIKYLSSYYTTLYDILKSYSM